ncbi:MAG: radical SAM protein [Patescibacteria group bacterium]|nr:radical SAM protein [Patescibacteria group bacterium]
MGYECNNSCQFCINSNKHELDSKSTKRIIGEMTVARKQGNTYLELIGGEPTIRPDIIDLISFARNLKFKNIVMATNGRMFAYKDFADRMIRAGLTDLIFSIHGHTAELHDSLTQARGSFDQLMRGISNVRSAGLKELGTNTTIVKQNYRQLERIGKLILDLGINNSEFIFVDPQYGAVNDNFLKFVPKISQAAPYILKLLDLRKGEKAHWHVRYVPLCHFENHLDQISELLESKIFYTQHLAPDFVNSDVEGSRRQIARIKTKICAGCDLFQQCEGIWKLYVQHYGDEELKPIRNAS